MPPPQPNSPNARGQAAFCAVFASILALDAHSLSGSFLDAVLLAFTAVALSVASSVALGPVRSASLPAALALLVSASWACLGASAWISRHLHPDDPVKGARISGLFFVVSCLGLVNPIALALRPPGDAALKAAVAVAASLPLCFGLPDGLTEAAPPSPPRGREGPASACAARCLRHVLGHAVAAAGAYYPLFLFAGGVGPTTAGGSSSATVMFLLNRYALAGLMGCAASSWSCMTIGLRAYLCGIPTSTLPFDSPLLSASPREFWSRRWNRGISDLFRETIFYPLSKGNRGGSETAGGGTTAVAAFATFLVSGLMHELMILCMGGTPSWRATLFFLSHWALCAVEILVTRGTGRLNGGMAHPPAAQSVASRTMGIVGFHVLMALTSPLFFADYFAVLFPAKGP